ncbi:MAG: acetylglutamate kinase [Clostridium sp.]|jgi:acetylglutamate kinase|uniref:acetylglutamate kinase n=1 Tax=Butyribacter sp. TaxID=2822465 RepID=UPI002A9A780B|nr:acetylglutamate kinase [Clostridium sp.]MDY5180258.1 acetylglutamate kinase [Butyribacter sp.]
MSEEEKEKYMDQITVKAETLIEALPYIRDFNNKIVVVKYGGSAMLDKKLEESVIKDVALLKLVGMRPIIVHGGGKEISKWINKIGKETEFIEGFRKTDRETMEVAEMVLNRLNKYLVQMVEKIGVKAIGICGKDGGMLKVDKKMPNGKDIGFVGDIKHVDTEILETLLDSDYIPIIAPIGMDDAGETYNINADDAACAIAGAIKAEKLAFLTDVEGVCMNPDDSSSLISVLDLNEANKLIEAGVISGGMLPKVTNCINAVNSGVGRVHILDGRREHCLLLEFFTKKGIGTAIIGDDSGYYSNEIEENN